MKLAVFLAVIVAVVGGAFWCAGDVLFSPDVAALAREYPACPPGAEGDAGGCTYFPGDIQAISPVLFRAMELGGEALEEDRESGCRYPAWDLALRYCPLSGNARVDLIRCHILAWRFSRGLGRERMTEVLVNISQYAPGIYGAEAACREVLQESVRLLSPEEAALLAAKLLYLPTGDRARDGREMRHLIRSIHQGLESEGLARPDFTGRLDRPLTSRERPEGLNSTPPPGLEPGGADEKSEPPVSIRGGRNDTAPVPALKAF